MNKSNNANTNAKMSNFKRVYTLRIKQELKNLGFEPVLEADNVNKPGFKTWLYEATPAFLEAFEEIANKGRE